MSVVHKYDTIHFECADIIRTTNVRARARYSSYDESYEQARIFVRREVVFVLVTTVKEGREERSINGAGMHPPLRRGISVGGGCVWRHQSMIKSCEI